MPNELLVVVLIAAVAALPLTLAGLLAELVEVPPRVLSAAWQVAAGMLLGIITLSLLPPVLRGGTALPMVLAFFVGGVLFTLMEWLAERRERAAGGEGEAISTGLFIGVLVDIAIDGVVIGIGSTLTLGTGLLLSLGLGLSTAPLAFVTIATARQQGMARESRRRLALLFGALIVAGPLAGYWGLRDQSEAVKQLLIALAAGFLITLVTQSMIPAAVRQAKLSGAPLFFIGGLSVYALLTFALR